MISDLYLHKPDFEVCGFDPTFLSRWNPFLRDKEFALRHHKCHNLKQGRIA